jgi:phosphate transport system permease protein
VTGARTTTPTGTRGVDRTLRKALARAPHVAGAAALALVLAPALSVAVSLLGRLRVEPGVARFVGSAALGSVVLVAAALALALPFGVAAGVHVASHPSTMLGKLARVAIDALAGVPSIVVGVVAYALVVLPTGRFSVGAGAVALGVVAFPDVARATAELVARAPSQLTETALGLGVRPWRVTLFILLGSKRSALVRGVLLVACRSLGEAAPLLFTSASGAAFEASFGSPMSSLAVEGFLSVHEADGGVRAAAIGLVLFAAAFATVALVRREKRRAP